MLKRVKKLISLGVMTVLGFSVVGCSSSNQENSDGAKITLVLSTGGVNDESFNQSAWEGALKAKEEYGVEVSYIESASETDYIQNIETAIDNDSDVVVGVGFQVGGKVMEVAKSYPEQKFMVIDKENEENLENVTSITFSEEQAGYLAGLVAAKMTKTNVLGWIGGLDIPSCSNFYLGFEKGAKEVNKDIKVLKQFTNSFTDAAKGKIIAQQMINSKADIILTASGTGNVGALEAIKENNKFAIGVDLPSNHLEPNHVVTSALKNIGQGLKLSIKDYVDGNFKGGQIRYDLTTGGVGFEKTDLIPQDVIEFVESKMK